MNKEYPTKFTDRVRVRPDQLQWLKQNKDTKTIAGFLDKIINQYKYEKSKPQRKHCIQSSVDCSRGRSAGFDCS